MFKLLRSLAAECLCFYHVVTSVSWTQEDVDTIRQWGKGK